MQNLFYSPKEKFLFWVSGYDESSTNVKTIISTLTNQTLFFRNQTKYTGPSVHTFTVDKSSRYKHMRVYYCVIDKVCDIVPLEAFDIGDSWTMINWVTN